MNRYEVEYDVGYEFSEFFDFCGWYTGKVTRVVDKFRRTCKYDDNTEEKCTIEEIDTKLAEAKLGEIGYRFCKKFPRGQGIFNGSVKKNPIINTIVFMMMVMKKFTIFHK